MDTISNRIMYVVKVKAKNKSEFARSIKVTPAYISKLSKNPESVPSDRTIYDICREFNVNETWLRTGEGEMFVQVSRDEEITSFLGDVLADKPNFRKKLISVMARMTVEEWEMLERKVTELIKEMKKPDL